MASKTDSKTITNASQKRNPDGDPRSRAVRVQNKPVSLVIQTAFLGDLYLGIPLLKHLRRLLPGQQLVLLCRKGLGAPLLKFGLVDAVVEVDKSSKESWATVTEKLMKVRYEWIICPHESFRTAMLVAKLKARHKVGYPRFFNTFIFNHRIERPLELPEALRQLALLDRLDVSMSSRLSAFRDAQGANGGLDKRGGLVAVPDWASMEIPALADLRARFVKSGPDELSSQEGRAMLRELLPDGQPQGIAFLAPGSVWPTKMWTETGFAEIAKRLRERGFRVALMGSKSEAELCGRIAQAVDGVVSFAGRTNLFDSFELLATAQLLVCNDSGAMHMAAAAGVPTVSVFGPTVLDFGYRPWQNSARVAQLELECRPCGKHGAKSCPLGTHACMKQIGSEVVWKKALTLMSNR